MGAPLSKRQADVDASIANVSMSGAIDGVVQLPDVKVVPAVTNALAGPEVTLTYGTLSPASAHEVNCDGNVGLAACSADVANSPVAAVIHRKYFCDRCIPVKIVAQPGQMTEVLYPLPAVSLDNTDGIHSSTYVHGYDYTRSVLTVTLESGASLVSLEEMLTDRQT